MHLRQGLIAAVCAAIVLAVAASAADAAKLRFESRKILTYPDATYVATPPTGRGRLFIVGRRGQIRILDHGKLLPTPFLDQRRITMTGAQRGLLSMAFAPDYASSGRVYIQYVIGPSDTVQLDELRRSATDPNRLDPSTRRHILNVGAAGDYHHGGQLTFGPDGMLWMSTGVSGDPPSAQDMGDLHGKILRIDPRPGVAQPYTVPPDNPYAFSAGVRPEIWAAGLRNAWRFSFDPVTGDMAIGDVGQDTYEEVDYLHHAEPAGANFGFDVYEGFHKVRPNPTPNRYVPPVLEHKHNPYCAVMGGYFVRDRSLGSLYGKYLYGDLCRSKLRAVTLNAGGASGDHAVGGFVIPGPISLSEDNQRRLYSLSVDGGIYRLVGIPVKQRKAYRPSRRRIVKSRYR